MAILTQTPDSLSLSRNIKDVIISSSAEVRFRLKKGSTVLLDESYQPDTSGQITIDIRDVVTSSLSIAIPTSDSYEQTGAVGSFEIYLDSSSSADASFTAVLGGVSGGVTASTFLPANFLTWQAQEKEVTANQPEWLTYYFAGAYSVNAKFYNKDGTDKTVTLMTGAAGKVYSVNCQFSRLWALGATTVDSVEKERYGFIDVWVENSGTRLTYVQRYCFRRAEALDEVYLCQNSIGGIDTFLFAGEKKLIPELGHTVGSFGDVLRATNTDAKRRYSQNTGILKTDNSRNLWDFFCSLHTYCLKDGTVTPVVLDSSTIEYSGIETANSWYFEYRLSDDDGLLKVQRSINFPAVIEIPGPDQGVYYIAPRVVDYPSATIDSSLLLLLQSPYSQSWMRASLADLQTFFNPARRLTQLADILLTDPAVGQVLKYDGSKWVNGTNGGGGSITVDSALSLTSENPVQNKVINTALTAKQDTISDLTTIRSNAANGNTAYRWGDHANAGYLTSSDNAASATKLATSRTIWGQSFDGAADVSGALSGATTGAFSGGVTMATSSSDNKVGIGTASPSYKLHVVGDVGIGGSIYGRSSFFRILNFNSQEALSLAMSFVTLGGGTAEAGLTTNIDGYNVYLRTGTAHSSTMALTNDGDVGIGTTSPSYRLHVNGTFLASDAATFGNTLTVTGAATLNGGLTVNGSGYVSGNLGVGITAEQKLDVVGKLRLRRSTDSTKYVDLEVDSSGNLKINGDIYATGGVTAYQS